MASNWMELNLSPEEDAFVRAQAALYQAQYIKTIDTIFDTAKAIRIIADRHRNSGISGAYGDALVQYGFIARDGGPMNKAIRSFYNTLLEHEAEVRAWWEAVPERTKRDWLSAKAVYTHWDRARRPPEPKPSYAGVTTTVQPSPALSPALAARDKKIAELEARIAELGEEPASARSTDEGPDEDDPEPYDPFADRDGWTALDLVTDASDSLWLAKEEVDRWPPMAARARSEEMKWVNKVYRALTQLRFKLEKFEADNNKLNHPPRCPCPLCEVDHEAKGGDK